MTALDDKLVPKAKALIAKVGVTATFSRKIGAYDDATGEVVDDNDVTQVTSTPPLRLKRYLGGLVMKEELQVIINGEWEPAIDDTVFVSGALYTALSIRPIYTGEEVAAYVVGLE